MFGFFLFGLNVLAGLSLLRFGSIEEKAVVWAGAAYIGLPPLIYDMQIGTFRYGVFALELVLFVVLLIPSLKIDRWWPIAACGVQALACFTHIVPMFMSDIYIWSTVTVRLALWVGVSILLLAGAWETWAHRAMHSKGLGNVA